MKPAQKSLNRWARKIASAVVGRRPSADALRSRIEEALKAQPDLPLEKTVESVRRAAREILLLRLVLGAVIGLMLLAAIALVTIWLIPQALPTSPIPAIASPTITPVPLILQGHIYRGQTLEGLGNVEISLDVYDGNQWDESVVTTTTNLSGSFVLEIPARWHSAQKCQIRVNPPSPWNGVKLRQGNGWTWSNITPNIFTATLQGVPSAGLLEIEVTIQRTFTGTLYLQGEGAPSSVVIALYALSDTQEVTQVVTGPASTITYPYAAPFALTHIGVHEDTQYQIQITDPAGKDWAVSGPSDVSKVEGSSLLLTPGTKTTVTDIVLAGPFPITLTYEMAQFEPPLGAGVWQITGTNDITYTVVTRQDPNQPQNARAFWPVYLPGGYDYEIWVGIPGQQTAALSYTLYLGQSGAPTTEISDTALVTAVSQCSVNEPANAYWQQTAVYSSSALRGDGIFWIVADEGRAQPTCNNQPFQVLVWKLEVRRKR